MNSLTLFSLIAGILELSVPVYGLLLIRRFGRRNMGRFFAAAFCLLSLLHLVRWLNGNAIGPANLYLIVVFASVLLLIGMGHLQGLYTLRRQNECEGEKLSANWQVTLREKTAELASTNQQLLEQIARHREVEQALRQSEQQYRFLFTQSPQPQWIFDLRSLRVLAVNRAALGLFGYTLEEFTALSARRLLQPEAAGLFLRDAASPCPKARSRGHWGFCTKGGSCIEAEIGAVDLNYDGCPARLIVLSPLIERRTVEPQQSPVTKIETVNEPPRNIPQAVHRTASVPDSQPEVVLHKSPEPAPVAAPHQSAPAEIRSTAPTRELTSLPAGNSAPVKSLEPTPRVSNISRTVAGKQPELRRPQVTPVRPKPAPPRPSEPGKETILLVEPEGKSRGLARFILSRQGYRVIETDCSSTVLALWESESTRVDVLLTDVTLPEGISGNALAEHLRQTKPELKVVYTAAATEGENTLMDQQIVPKPYAPDKLIQAVRNCLI